MLLKVETGTLIFEDPSGSNLKMGKRRSQIEFTISVSDQKRLRGPSEDFIILCHSANEQWVPLMVREDLARINPDHNLFISKIQVSDHNSNALEPIIPVHAPIVERQEKGPNAYVFPVGGYDFGYPPDWKRILQKNQLDRLLFQFLYRQDKSILLVRIIPGPQNDPTRNNNAKTGKPPSSEQNPDRTRLYTVRVSHLLDHKHLKSVENPSSLRKYLMGRLQVLKSPFAESRWKSLAWPLKRNPVQKEIIAPIQASIIRSELNKLLPEQKVLVHQNFELYLVPFNQVPNIMLEIGRLREVTFRNAAEGTGHFIDLDDYDVFYRHLFIWDRAKEQIVGAYRIGEGHRLIPKLGHKGFYISTLFKFKPEFIKVLYQCVELGRSFIIPEYQKSHILLFLMWKAIFKYIVSHPQNQFVIGPVSISNEYSKISRLLIMDYLNKYHKHPEFDQLVKAKKPYRFIKYKGTEQIIIRNLENDIHKLDQLISEIQIHSNKLPVLLRQYLKQNAQVITYNRDPKFKNVLDALMILEIQKLPTDFSNLLEGDVKN